MAIRLQAVGMIAQMLARPDSALRTISCGPAYFVPAIAVFAASLTFSFYSSHANPITGVAAGHGLDAAGYATMYAKFVMAELLKFAAVFYVGKRLGGTAGFRRIFSVLSYCLVPIMVGNAAVLSGSWIFHEYFLTADVPGDGLVPSFALDFTASAGFGYAILPFLAWSVALSVKAVKTTNGFSNKRSFGVIALSWAAMYLFEILYAILSIMLQEVGLIRLE